MSVKASISLTDQQNQFARTLVVRGHYSSLSAVFQRGIELVRAEAEREEMERAALRAIFLKIEPKAPSSQKLKGSVGLWI